MVKITTYDLTEQIFTPLGFVVFLSISWTIVVFIAIAFWKRKKINVWIENSQFKAQEKNAMYSKKEFQLSIIYSVLLTVLIGGFLLFGVGYYLTPLSYHAEREMFLLASIIFAILVIPGVPLFGWKYGILYRRIKNRYKKYLSEKDFILETLAKEIVPCFSNPEISVKFDEIGFENGQGKKILKLLSGTIIEENY